MPNINITVAGKVATSQGQSIVCGNSDYTVTFAFDSEWVQQPVKTARFAYIKDGKLAYQEVTINGNVAQVPTLSDIAEVYVGVYAGDLITTTPARVPCLRSILCGGGTHEDPGEDVYNQLLALLNSMGRVYIGSEEPTDPTVTVWIDPDGDPTNTYEGETTDIYDEYSGEMEDIEE